jgi:predicted RNA binding protein YcfA (HicA-like mRNA interferase family)
VRLPRGLSGWQAVRAFERAGWQHVRTHASHAMLQKGSHDFTLAVPLHHELGPGLLRGPIRDAGMTVEEFAQLL